MTRSERGATAVEFAVILPVIVLLIAGLAAGGRLWYARVTVERLADASARAATVARSAAGATTDARRVLTTDAAASGVRCAEGAPSLELDLAGFALPVGQPAWVSASVRCTVPLSDLLLPGLPGSVTVTADARSSLDRYRGRR